MVAFRKRSGIGFIREGTIAVELEFTEEMVGGGRGVVRFVVVVLAHGMLRRFDRDPRRSEEHTSELQSLMRISYAVFCLKKKKRKQLPTTKARTAQIHTPNITSPSIMLHPNNR